jgi:hypothetical protein
MITIGLLLNMGIKSPFAILFGGITVLFATFLAGVYILYRQDGLFAMKKGAEGRRSYVPLVGLKSA